MQDSPNENSGLALAVGVGIAVMIALIVTGLLIMMIILLGIGQSGAPAAHVAPLPTVEPVFVHDAPPDGTQYTWTPIVSGYDNPIYVTHAGDGSNRLFGVEQTGIIWVIENGRELPQPFLDISMLLSQDVHRGVYSERGLLGLAFHPDYENNGQFFISYTDRHGNSVIARYRVSPINPNRADPNSQEIILTQVQPNFDHNGGMILFGPDGYLYIGFGDGGPGDDPNNYGQNTGVLLGKLLRIDVDVEDAPYGIPPDNPFVGREEFAPEIWAFGLRNPWRFSFDRATGDLYIGDVGQWTVEEINIMPPGVSGLNFGWKVYEGNLLRVDPPPEPPHGIPYTPPILTFDHSEGCSVTGGYVYRGASLPELNGYYFYGDYCSGKVWAAYRDAEGAWHSELIMETERQISSFGEDEAGELYMVDYKGDILRLERASEAGGAET